MNQRNFAMSRKLALLPLMSLMVISGLFALDFSIRPKGFAFIPLGEESTGRYTTGGGGEVALDIDFASNEQHGYD
jgi:hypothetical protein